MPDLNQGIGDRPAFRERKDTPRNDDARTGIALT
jgi:hypothetical protein